MKHEHDKDSITHPKNVWKLIYASIVACEYAPSDCYGVDENGEDIYVPWKVEWDLLPKVKNIGREELEFNELNYSEALRGFVRELENGKFTYPFTYEKYLRNKDVVDTVKAFGLDVEKFWYAIVFIHWLTEVKCVNVIKLTETTGEQMQKLRDYLYRAHSFTIMVEGKLNLKISDVSIINGIRDYLDIVLTENPNGFNDGYSYNVCAPSKDSLSLTKCMCFATARYLELFKNLGLPSQPKNRQSEYQTVSYNKMLLISRLMYFTKLTINKEFLRDDESLKGIINRNRGLSIRTANPSRTAF